MNNNHSEVINKNVAIVPPGGKLLYQDFALNRMCRFFKSHNIITYLVKIKDTDIVFDSFTDYLIEVDSQEDLIVELKSRDFNLIISRSWMHRYSFSAELLENFENIIFYIKDWHVELPRDKYKYQYSTDEDYDAIKKLFSSKKTILSHYTDEYTKKTWSKHYNTSENQFKFFPEYCSKDNFFSKTNISYSPEKIKLLYIGIINATTSMPNDLAYGKSFFDSILNITKQSLNLDIMVLEKNYDRIQKEAIFKDYLYEDKFNKYFSIVKGSALNMHKTNDYHFGIFQFLSPIDNHQYLRANAFAVVSKFAYYMEAGLPIIVHECFSVAKIVEKYKIGIVVKDSEIMKLNDFLNISQKDYLSLVENVYSFRESYSYNVETMRPILEAIT